MLPNTVEVPLSPATQEFWDTSFDRRLDRFRQLRESAPQFHDEPGGSGFWSIVRYDQVVDVSRRPEIFSSAAGFTIADFPAEALAFAGSMIAMDDPKHRRFRGIVQGAFTHRSVRQIAGTIDRHAQVLIDAIPVSGEFDFVNVVAGQLPLVVICELLGIPPSDHHLIKQLTDQVVGNSNELFTNSPGMSPSVVEIYSYAAQLGASRKTNPSDDVISRLLRSSATGATEGAELTVEEFASFLILLITAGYDTTRQTLAWAAHLLTTHPDQLKLLVDDFDSHIDGAIDEVVRWASPVPYMRRTATATASVGGRTIAAGDKVVMWYLSANHDEAVFPDPLRFDVTRSNASRQLGFGARDPHHCLGIHLARLQVRILLKHLIARYPHLASTPPDLVLSAFISGIHRLPCSVDPEMPWT
ncbi:cytochrome P450 [Rhodococcus sp. KRD175]|uniref:cytochrome P450 n=1 Tax=Rhodococcus sp. KRD175 TaxID=2729729 RepID=UPI00050CA9A5|nr:cytochrome P450 [Rhodococcus sp. KRD175]